MFILQRFILRALLAAAVACMGLPGPDIDGPTVVRSPGSLAAPGALRHREPGSQAGELDPSPTLVIFTSEREMG